MRKSNKLILMLIAVKYLQSSTSSVTETEIEFVIIIMSLFQTWNCFIKKKNSK